MLSLPASHPEISRDRAVHYSAVLVLCDPERLSACAKEITARLGIEVTHTDPATGRLITILESDSPDGLRLLVREIRALDDVRLAEPINHHVDRRTDITDPQTHTRTEDGLR